MDPNLYVPVPQIIHVYPEWIRFYPTRYRSLYISIRCGTDPIRSDTEAYTSSPGMDPILSDPTPQLKPFFRNGSDLIRSDTGAYTSSYGMDPPISDPIPDLIHPLPSLIRSHPTRNPNVCISFRDVSDHTTPAAEPIHNCTELLRT